MGPIIDMDNRFNKVFSFFDLFNPEFSPSFRIVDNFSSHFSFHSFSKHNDDNLKSCTHILDNLAIMSSEDSFCTLIVTNASIKNNVTIFIVYIHIHNKDIIKTLYHVVNVTSTEAELFIIRYQATNIQEILKIVVITDLIHTT